MGKIFQVKTAIDMAIHDESKLSLSGEAIRVPGFTANKIRHLLNNLGSVSFDYFEVGVHRGAMTVATAYKNHQLRCIACDNWSQFDEDGHSRTQFFDHIKQFDIPSEVINADCFSIDPEKLSSFPIDLYVYDGEHSYESQKKAVTYFLPAMADEFVFCCDDYDWPDVQRGTADGIKESGVEVVFESWLSRHKESDEHGFWNGFYVAIFRKPKQEITVY